MTAYMHYEPLSMIPADGWRAAYIQPAEDGGPGWSSEPLIAWAVYEVTERSEKNDIETGARSMPREIAGAVWGGYMMNPEEISNFWFYMAPGSPDPSPEDVAQQQKVRAADDERRAAARARAAHVVVHLDCTSLYRPGASP